jgi:MerR family transcriptional regulator, copper efflux regulator
VLKLDDYLRIRQAAECLGVCRNTLRNWEIAGKIRVHRHPANNYRLYKIDDLDKMLLDAEQSARSVKRKPR